MSKPDIKVQTQKKELEMRNPDVFRTCTCCPFTCQLKIMQNAFYNEDYELIIQNLESMSNQFRAFDNLIFHTCPVNYEIFHDEHKKLSESLSRIIELITVEPSFKNKILISKNRNNDR